MTQITPVQIPQCQTQMQPNYNAVKIDINNPQVNADSKMKMPAQTPVYAYPKAPIYDVPKQSVYKPEQSPAEKQAPAVPPAPVVVKTPTPVATAPAATPAEPKKVEVKAPEANTPRPENK